MENEAIDHSELLQGAFDKIRKAAAGKTNRPGEAVRYGRGYILLIAFDDWGWFGSTDDIAALTRYVEEQVATMALNFDCFYVVGLSGETCERFALPSIEAA